jgi:hypothetical protein
MAIGRSESSSAGHEPPAPIAERSTPPAQLRERRAAVPTATPGHPAAARRNPPACLLAVRTREGVRIRALGAAPVGAGHLAAAVRTLVAETAPIQRPVDVARLVDVGPPHSRVAVVELVTVGPRSRVVTVAGLASRVAVVALAGPMVRPVLAARRPTVDCRLQRCCAVSVPAAVASRSSALAGSKAIPCPKMEWSRRRSRSKARPARERPR